MCDIFQIMSQRTSFLMRKYRTCSLIIIREKHSLRETVRWAQKTLFGVKLAHLIVQVHKCLVSSVANPHWFVKYVKSCNAEEFDHRKINYGNMYGKVQLYDVVTKYHSKTSQNHKNTHKCVNFSLYNAQ